MARKKHGDDGGGYNWMDTYGDMVTLLLTFFIMLFSMSTIDEASWQVLVQAFSKSAPDSPQQMALPLDGETGDQAISSIGEYDLMVKDEIDLEHERPVTMSELYDYLKAYVDQEGMAGSVTVEKDAMSNVYMRFDNNIFFNSDSSVLRQESYPVLQFIGECITGVEDQIFMVRVVGHTAAVAQQDYPVNDWELSSSRANQVAIFFEEESGFEPTKLMTNGYGKNRPRFPNVTAAGRAKNRRVEIMIIGNDFNTNDSEQLLSILRQMTDMEIEESPENSSEILKSDITTEAEQSAAADTLTNPEAQGDQSAASTPTGSGATGTGASGTTGGTQGTSPPNNTGTAASGTPQGGGAASGAQAGGTTQSSTTAGGAGTTQNNPTQGSTQSGGTQPAASAAS